MAEIRHINGGHYLGADDLLAQRMGKHVAVALVGIDENGKVETYCSSGFTNEKIIHSVRQLNFNIEMMVFDGEGF